MENLTSAYWTSPTPIWEIVGIILLTFGGIVYFNRGKAKAIKVMLAVDAAIALSFLQPDVRGGTTIVVLILFLLSVL